MAIDDPHDALARVTDEATFLAFVDALVSSRLRGDAGDRDPFGRGPDGWENDTIAAFLEGAAAWARDSDFGERQGLAGASPWRRFATFLYCGKVYE